MPPCWMCVPLCQHGPCTLCVLCMPPYLVAASIILLILQQLSVLIILITSMTPTTTPAQHTAHRRTAHSSDNWTTHICIIQQHSPCSSGPPQCLHLLLALLPHPWLLHPCHVARDQSPAQGQSRKATKPAGLCLFITCYTHFPLPLVFSFSSVPAGAKCWKISAWRNRNCSLFCVRAACTKKRSSSKPRCFCFVSAAQQLCAWDGGTAACCLLPLQPLP